MTHLDATIVALWNEYATAYYEAKEHAGDMIWQSIKIGPPGSHVMGRPDWAFHERQRPGGGMYWDSGKERVNSSWPRDETWHEPNLAIQRTDPP